MSRLKSEQVLVQPALYVFPNARQGCPQRAVETEAGAFFIPDDNRPDVHPGDKVKVSYCGADQYATILEDAEAEFEFDPDKDIDGTGDCTNGRRAERATQIVSAYADIPGRRSGLRSGSNQRLAPLL